MELSPFWQSHFIFKLKVKLSPLCGCCDIWLKIPSSVWIHGKHFLIKNPGCRNDYDLLVILTWNMVLIYGCYKYMARPWQIASRWQPPLSFMWCPLSVLSSSLQTICYSRPGCRCPLSMKFDLSKLAGVFGRTGKWPFCFYCILYLQWWDSCLLLQHFLLSVTVITTNFNVDCDLEFSL